MKDVKKIDYFNFLNYKKDNGKLYRRHFVLKNALIQISIDNGLKELNKTIDRTKEKLGL